MTASTIEEGLDELVDATWSWRVVEMAMFSHATSPSCVGYTYGVDGYSRCGDCGWEISASSKHGDDRARGRFALIALSMVGITFQLIADEEDRRYPLVDAFDHTEAQ
jgi:hypothetical protein